MEGGRLSRLGASPGPRGIPPLSGPSRGSPERAGDPGSGVPCGVRAVKQSRGCPAVLELLGKRQSRSMPSTSRWQSHAVTRCSSEGGETAERVFNPARRALGVTTARESVLCYLLSASDFFFSTTPGASTVLVVFTSPDDFGSWESVLPWCLLSRIESQSHFAA